MLIGPHTSECMSSNKSLDRSPSLENGAFVILPHKQDSQFSNELNSNESSIPFSWSLAMRFIHMTETTMPKESSIINFRFNPFRINIKDRLIIFVIEIQHVKTIL